MKNILRVLSLIIFAFLMFNISGCKDDEENKPDKKALLTAHVWSLDELSTSSSDGDIQIAVAFISALMNNATMNFTAGGTYTLTILQQSDNGTWEFNAGETSIILDKGTDSETEQQILQLTSSVLELKEYVDDEDLGTFDITYNWVK